jgi:hypothetical protein
MDYGHDEYPGDAEGDDDEGPEDPAFGWGRDDDDPPEDEDDD